MVRVWASLRTRTISGTVNSGVAPTAGSTRIWASPSARLGLWNRPRTQKSTGRAVGRQVQGQLVGGLGVPLRGEDHAPAAGPADR